MTDRATTVVVLAKEPVPGRVKTRLQSAFTPEQAAELAACALEDTLATVEDAAPGHRLVAWEGTGATWRNALVSRGFSVVPQGGGTLNDRLTVAFRAAHQVDPGGRVLLIGMDTPQVTPELLSADWHGADAALGLSEDGGFWALGLRGTDPGVCLAGISMSTARTGAAQLARLVDLGLAVTLLPPLRDVDEPADAAAVADRTPALRFSRRHAELIADRPEQPVARLFDAAYRQAGPVVGGGLLSLDVGRWAAPADAVDEMVASRCEPPVIDLGCGPGRLVRALNELGLPALGVDISAEAVDRTRRRGALALQAAVADPLPAEGRWGTVLLVDGNVGLGGSVSWLLERSRRLIVPGGLVLCEVDPNPDRHQRSLVVLRSARARSAPLPWSRIGARALRPLAAGADLMLTEEWSAGGRVFVALRAS